MLGTNGGGYFNANSAHPWENPTPLANFVQMLSIFAIPGALCVTLGQMVKSPRHGWAVFAAMTLIAVAGIAVIAHFEQQGNPVFTSAPARTAATWRARKRASASPTPRSSRGSPRTPRAAPSTPCTTASRRSAAWCRCSTSSSARWSSAGSARGCTACSIYVLMAVFLAGLMVGRTPEYLGKKLDSRDIRLASIYILIPAFLILDLHRRRPARARWAAPASPTWPPPTSPAPPGSRPRTASPRCSTRSARPPATTAAPSPGSPRTRPTTRSSIR